MRFSLTPAQLATVATFATALASKGDATPVIMAAQLTVEGSTLTVVATDRYMAGVLTLELNSPAGEDGAALIPAATLRDAVKTFAKGHAIDVARGELGATMQCVNYPGTTIGALEPAGNYPPVARLLPGDDVELQDTPTGILLKPSMIGKLAAVRFPGDRSPAAAALAPWSFTSMPVSNPAKPGPVMATREEGTTTARVLIQPNYKPNS